MDLRALALSLVFAASSPLSAQAPTGWQLRLDRSSDASDPDNTPDVRVTPTASGFQVTTGPAAVLWHAKNTAAGEYTLRGTFHLLRPSGHVNYYGLVFGGSDLAGAKQNYLYFLVGQNGAFLVKHRAGDAVTHTIQGRTVHDAIARPVGNGKSVNHLEVRVRAGRIDYVVNGTIVHSTPRTGMSARTDGLWGVRVNHELDVRVEGLASSP